MKNSKNMNEVCYPFIHDSGYLCDFEVITDELCTQVGMAWSCMSDEFCDIKADLQWIQPLIFHINGSIRARLAITESDLQQVEECFQKYLSSIPPLKHAFILPQGTTPVPQLHLCRSNAKKAIRAMVRVEEEGRAVPDILPRLCNLLCNLFFIMTVVVNHRRGVTEIPFQSKSYGPLVKS